MFWACSSYYPRSAIAFEKGKQDSACYAYTLRSFIIPTAQTAHDEHYIFQQDNAPIHTLMYTMRFFNNKEMTVLRWPASSSDLNRIGNLWETLFYKYYDNNRVSDPVRELMKAFDSCWHNIPIESLQMLGIF